MSYRQGSRMAGGRAKVLLWLAGLLVAGALLSLAVPLGFSTTGGDVTAKTLLSDGQGPHGGQCPGESGEAGYHHCCASLSCSASAIADTAAAVIPDRRAPTIALAGAVLPGRPVAPEAQPPKLLSRL